LERCEGRASHLLLMMIQTRTFLNRFGTLKRHVLMEKERKGRSERIGWILGDKKRNHDMNSILLQ